ncbi:MAG TPA: response regulator [Caulobacteraceae bacterium]|jgi:CheY-like chemotaxis protein
MDSDGRPVVLLVEDDPLLRSVTADLMLDAGFFSIEASNAAEALAVLADHPEVDVVFTDLDMPGEMNGLGLAQRIGAMSRPVHVILTSGKAVAGEPPCEFVSKPYSISLVVRLMTSMIAASR